MSRSERGLGELSAVRNGVIKQVRRRRSVLEKVGWRRPVRGDSRKYRGYRW